ncbi:DNA-binding IclR family transcriptional regulator [Bradyrhizobium ottawaense]
MDKTRIARNAISPRQGAQAIRRALAVLRILAAGREDGVPLAEVIRATGLTRPTVHRIIHVLIEEGIVERHERTGRYAIGNQVPELALARPRPSRLLIAANPSLQRASTEIGDTMFLTVRTGNDTLCVDRRIGIYPIQVLSIEVGARRPLGVSSAGVAILAAMPAPEARKIVAANEKRFEAYKTDVATVLGEVTAARRLGIRPEGNRPRAGHEIDLDLDQDPGWATGRRHHRFRRSNEARPPPRAGGRGDLVTGGAEYRAGDRWVITTSAQAVVLRLSPLAGRGRNSSEA